MPIGSKLRGFQLGLESTPGTIVAANRLIKNGTFKNKRQNNVKKVTAEGHRTAIGQQRGKRWSEWSVSGDLGYNIAAYAGCGIYDNTTIVTPTNPATGAYQYTYQDIQGTFHTPQAFSFEYGNSLGENSKFPYGTMTDYTIKISETECTYELAGFGAYPTKNITMTASPTLIAANIVNFTDCRVSYSTTFSGLSSGKLLTSKELELSVKGKYKSVFYIDDATISIGGIVEKQPELTGKITVTEGSESDNFLGNLEASTLFYIQFLATGPLITAGTPNTYNLIKYTWACFVEQEDESDLNDLFVGQYTIYGAEDTTNGDTNYSVINTLASL